MADRDWERFQTPKNLTLALGGEVGELMELVQWQTDEEVLARARTGDGAAALSDEIADVLIYAIRLADVLGLEPSECVERKIAANATRYPAERVRGSAEKQPPLGV